MQQKQDIDTPQEPVISKTNFVGKDVLEIGCGSGGFTLSYLYEAKSIYAIDPDKDSLYSLQSQWESQSIDGKLTVHSDSIEDATLPKESFDVAVFSNSF